MIKFSEIINSNKEKLKGKTKSGVKSKRIFGYVSKINGKKLSNELKIIPFQKNPFLKLHHYSGLDDIKKDFKTLKKEGDNLKVKFKKKDANLIERKKS